MKPYYQYADDVITGKQTAGKLVKLAVSRFNTWLHREDIEFREEKADRAIRFVSLLKHFKGKHAGKPFILQPWQAFYTAAVYGFYYRGTNRRVVRYSYLEVARKNGKTAFAAALCLYHLVADGEAGAEVDMAANSKDQAKIAFEFASKFARSLNEGKKKYLDAFRDSILFDLTDSKMKVFAADASLLDGFDASMVLLDEYHAAKDDQLKNVLQSSQASRENPMFSITTTAGLDPIGVCFEYRTMCVEMLNGLIEDDSLFALIYCMDDDELEGSGWREPKNWVKANPNLGVTVNFEFLSTQAQKAVNKPSEEVGIKTKSFNIWCDSPEVWIPDKHIISSSREVNLTDYYDSARGDMYGGIDLSSVSDLAAMTCMIPRDGVYYFKTKYYLPEESLSTSPLKDKYKEWLRRGHLKITPGNVTDYDYILADLMAIDREMPFRQIGYDPWNATQFVIAAQNAGLPMQEYSQTIGNFNRPTKSLERLMLSGRAVIDNNPINRFCFRNVVLRRDYNDNVKPDKSKANNKIDGVISKIEALGVYLTDPCYNFDI